MDVYIYALKSPSGDIRYIGVTNNLALRLAQHLEDKSNTPKSRWIQRLLADDTKPELMELEKVPAEKAAETERKWLEVAKKEGWRLTNSRDGGAGCNYGEGTLSLNFFLRFPDREMKTETEEWAARAGYDSLTEYILEAIAQLNRSWEEKAKD